MTFAPLRQGGERYTVETTEGMGMDELRPGYKLTNGALVAHYTHLEDAGNGYYANGTALCINPDNPEGYVVWRLFWHSGYPTEAGSWQATNGNYFNDFGKALEKYRDRGGKF